MLCHLIDYPWTLELMPLTQCLYFIIHTMEISPFLAKRFLLSHYDRFNYTDGILLLVILVNVEMTKRMQIWQAVQLFRGVIYNVFKIIGMKGKFQTRILKKTIAIWKMFFDTVLNKCFLKLFKYPLYHIIQTTPQKCVISCLSPLWLKKNANRTNRHDKYPWLVIVSFDMALQIVT